MIELRHSPRINVIWRATLELPDGRVLFPKIINLSAEGVLMLCPEHLPVLREYPISIDIPALDFVHENYQVDCTVMVKHAILSGDIYRIGASFWEISGLHKELVNAWLSKTLKASE